MENSYYSVFVETDLSKASTISGELLGSEDAIANYIAEMMHWRQNHILQYLTLVPIKEQMVIFMSSGVIDDLTVRSGSCDT